MEVKKEEAPVVAKAPEPVKPVEQPKVEEKPVSTPTEPAEPEVIKARTVKLSGPNIVGKITLPTVPDRRNNPVASSSDRRSCKTQA